MKEELKDKIKALPEDKDKILIEVLVELINKIEGLIRK